LYTGLQDSKDFRTDFSDFTPDLRYFRSDFKDYRNFRKYGNFRDFRDFRIFVHRISEVVYPSHLIVPGKCE